MSKKRREIVVFQRMCRSNFHTKQKQISAITNANCAQTNVAIKYYIDQLILTRYHTCLTFLGRTHLTIMVCLDIKSSTACSIMQKKASRDVILGQDKNSVRTRCTDMRYYEYVWTLNIHMDFSFLISESWCTWQLNIGFLFSLHLAAEVLLDQKARLTHIMHIH